MLCEDCQGRGNHPKFETGTNPFGICQSCQGTRLAHCCDGPVGLSGDLGERDYSCLQGAPCGAAEICDHPECGDGWHDDAHALEYLKQRGYSEVRGGWDYEFEHNQ